jgi:gamma-glutamyltranspeptidase/glutathione hydrolase
MLRLVPKTCLLASIFLLQLFSVGFALSAASFNFPPSQSSRKLEDYVAKTSGGAAIATAHPLASEAAMEMIKKGGNAADAAVAASFVISVVRPQSTGIGGGGFLIYHDAKSIQQRVYDFRERAPAAATRDMYLDKDGNPKNFEFNGHKLKDASVNGHLSVGIPGLVRGLEEFHQHYGKLKFSEVISPAIRAARDGFTVYPSLAEDIEERREVLNAFPSSSKIFIPNGKPLVVGDQLVQSDLAKTLELIAEQGSSSFYTGKISELILAEMKRGGGIINAKDLADYRVKERQAVEGRFGEFKIISMPPPSSGGAHIIQMLNMMSELKIANKKRHEPQTLHLIAETMRRAFADRAELLGDTDFIKLPLRGILNPDYAKSLAKGIQYDAITPSSQFKKSNAWSFESDSTTHLSVVDDEGNAVSSTQTINYSFGSCVVAEGTGIVLNDEMDDFSMKPGVPNAYGLIGSEANAIAAGKTMLSSMSPTIVLNKDNKVHLVVGSPGGPRIISATFQTILNSLAFKMSPQESVHSLRIHHQWMPDKLRIERAYGETIVNQLKKFGHDVELTDQIGDVQAIMRHKNGWIAVSDTRSEGKPATTSVTGKIKK